MSREDASLVVAVLSLLVAVAAMWVSVTAIRRDRPDLRVTSEDAAAGSRYLKVVNVGTRPVRIERLLVRRWRWRWLRRFGSTVATPGWWTRQLEAGMREADLPVPIEPASAVVVHYGVMGFSDWAHGYRWDLLVEDAAGRKYAVPYSRAIDFGPEGFRERG